MKEAGGAGRVAGEALASVTREGRVVRVVFRRGIRLDGPGAAGLVARIVALAGGEKVRLFVDMGGLRLADHASRQIGASPQMVQLTERMALVVDNPVAAMVGNFFLQVARPQYPTRLFRDPAAATEWLLAEEARR